MRRKELTKEVRDLIVKKYQSGEGYKCISKSLDIPWSTVKSTINKWKKCGTTVTLIRTGRPPKIDGKTERKLIREASKRPTATLKELQQFLASTGCFLHVTTISRFLHLTGLRDTVVKQRPVETKDNPTSPTEDLKTEQTVSKNDAE